MIEGGLPLDWEKADSKQHQKQVLLFVCFCGLLRGKRGSLC